MRVKKRCSSITICLEMKTLQLLPLVPLHHSVEREAEGQSKESKVVLLKGFVQMSLLVLLYMT